MKHAISIIFSVTLCLASQVAFSELTPEYQHHILAVDEDGNALVRIVQRTLAKDGTYRYRASHKMLDGEENQQGLAALLPSLLHSLQSQAPSGQSAEA